MIGNTLTTLYFFLLLAVLCSCSSSSQSDEPLFELTSPEETNITFSNDLSFSQSSNIYRYRNFYNGGGVAAGDINNDGLIDLFFTSNENDNRLYLNKGNFEFEDITETAGVAGTRAWSTGVSMADVNGDGLLDIYVCNSGVGAGDDRQNELFINNGDSTFTDRAAAFGLNDPALSIHASFFDYDRDGDLDMYLVNNSFRMIGSFDQEKNIRNIRNDEGGDKLYRNDGDSFTDVSEEAGIYGSEIGFGLGVSVGDLNRDGWPDMYISNDFFERDYLYINNKNGTFKEVLEKQIKSISAAAMGADIGDLNGDGFPEIFVTDMLPEPESRLKKLTTFDSWERYQKYVRDGYYHQFTRNTLQLNNANGTFSEVGRYAGVEATDWSWGANIADFDLDGRRDIFVANGMFHDITNLDYLKFASREDTKRRIIQDSTVNFLGLIENIPSTPIANYAFKNMGKMKFSNHAEEWGIDHRSFSNGSAYADLDNDGDLEMILNNLNSTASVYHNRAVEKGLGHWLQIKFEGAAPNYFGIGAQLTAWADDRQWYAEQMPIRGFQSTVDHRMHIGLGEATTLDSLIVDWPDGRQTKLYEVSADQMLRVKQADARQIDGSISEGQRKIDHAKSYSNFTEQTSFNWSHKENKFDDFNRNSLIYHMRSAEGPAACKADVNGDSLEDFYVGGARSQAGALFVQSTDGSFSQRKNPAFDADSTSEDVSCKWFEANGDGYPDLYVGSGSNEFPSSSAALADRLYINDGDGKFSRADLGASSWIYKTAGSVSAQDFDDDGDDDLFLGVRLQPFGVGLPVQSYLLKNDGTGQFTDATADIAPEMEKLGMVTDSQWGDIDSDGDADLVVAGEWMPITIFENKEGAFSVKESFEKPAKVRGWWKTIVLDDLDGDGDLDFVAGNQGENTRMHGDKENPLEVYVNDFDGNGKIEQLLATYKSDSLYLMALRHDLLEQLPYLERKYPDYESYAGAQVSDIFSREKLESSYHTSVTQLSSVVGWNDGEGNFDIEELPMRAQLSPINGIAPVDLNGDKRKELITGGNFYYSKPEVGRYDASYGLILGMDNNKFQNITPAFPNFSIDGEVRKILPISGPDNSKRILIIRNNDSPLLFSIKP